MTQQAPFCRCQTGCGVHPLCRLPAAGKEEDGFFTQDQTHSVKKYSMMGKSTWSWTKLGRSWPVSWPVSCTVEPHRIPGRRENGGRLRLREVRKSISVTLQHEAAALLCSSERTIIWGVPPRRGNCRCAAGRIPGAVKMAAIWLIPKAAVKPADRRRKNRGDSRGKDCDM